MDGAILASDISRRIIKGMSRTLGSRNRAKRVYENGCGCRLQRKFAVAGRSSFDAGEIVQVLCEPPVFGIILRLAPETRSREARVLLATGERGLRRYWCAVSVVRRANRR